MHVRMGRDESCVAERRQEEYAGATGSDLDENDFEAMFVYSTKLVLIATNAHDIGVSVRRVMVDSVGEVLLALMISKIYAGCLLLCADPTDESLMLDVDKLLAVADGK